MDLQHGANGAKHAAKSRDTPYCEHAVHVASFLHRYFQKLNHSARLPNHSYRKAKSLNVFYEFLQVEDHKATLQTPDSLVSCSI